MTREETAALELALEYDGADVGIDLATGQPTITVPSAFGIRLTNAIGAAGFRAVYLASDFRNHVYRVDRVLTAAEERAMLVPKKPRKQRSAS